jgi:hypothetical protein
MMVDQLPKFLSKLEPKDRLDVVVKLLEFALPRLKGIEATIEQPESEQPRYDLGLLSKKEREAFYALYNKACGSNDETQAVTHDKTYENG